MEHSGNETQNSQFPQGTAYLPSEDVELFYHALDTLDRAREMLEMVAGGMRENAELRIEN
ncbi:MAG: hypothetical protein LBN71_08535 [Tannerella sp.]|jgi:hypothetical protein|nr:hypothetical protein [Tannerella sp.]